VTSKLALSRLLSGRNRLSRLEQEQILDGVLGAVAPRKKLRWWFAVMPAVAAAAALLVVLAPWRGPPRGDDFTARGGGQALGMFTPSCAHQPPQRRSALLRAPAQLGRAHDCRAGDKLLFDLDGTVGYRYFAAFSQRGDGAVLWYFPSSDEATSVELPRQLGSGVLDRGVVLGGEHDAGTYRVFGVFSNAPLTRAQLRARFDDERRTAGPGTEVVERELIIR
jgi:hypothetical protein